MPGLQATQASARVLSRVSGHCQRSLQLPPTRISTFPRRLPRTTHIPTNTCTRTFSSTSCRYNTPDPHQPNGSNDIPEFSQLVVSLALVAHKMYRHRIEPGGDRPYRTVNLLGQEARGDEILATDTPLPINLAGDFLVFINDNKLPNGRINPLPVLTPEEKSLFAKPYSQWAPAPYNSTISPLDCATFLFMNAFTPMSGMFDLLENIISGVGSGPGGLEGFSLIDYELYVNKQRAWGGIVPLSNRRWEDKGFDQPDEYVAGVPPKNLVKAMDHLEKTNTFLCFNIPDVLSKMRNAYNKAYDQLAHFDTALAAYYTQQQRSNLPPAENRGKAADLWAEFFFSRVEYMIARTHQWYTAHTNALHAQIVEEIRNSPQTLPHSEQGQRDLVATAFQKFDTLCAHRLKTEAIMLLPLTGFKNTLRHWKHLSSPPIINWTEHINAQGRLPIPPEAGTYPQDVLQREQVLLNRHSHLANELVQSTIDPSKFHETHVTGNADSCARVIQQQWEALDQASSELRGTPLIPTPITEDLWITQLRARLAQPPPSPQYQTWGWVGFRLCYTHTPEEWNTYSQRLKSDIDSSLNQNNSNILGCQGTIRQTCKFHWLDGRQFNIPENDVSAARRVLKSLRDSKFQLLEGMILPSAFLVADKESIDSYLNPPVLPGQELIDAEDLKPHVVVAQSAMFDATAAASDKEAPGYNGQVNVAGGVLMEDVWPGLFMRLYELKHFWNLAAEHPAGLYLGVDALYQTHLWGQFNKMRMGLFKEAQKQAQGSSSNGQSGGQ